MQSPFPFPLTSVTGAAIIVIIASLAAGRLGTHDRDLANLD